ncbi:hypothetical protein [Thiothrix nivea]|uniref:Cytochrome c domain-containing protein n=1 Tax=Thiothrix nivea (strain ATCC 35100 / DSM 5205 / JP2) TaxID=870187 RepID=A0A656HIU8_THINJ|nr:hypothetical protein [Thiothrix nivea]EIJ36303.1 hypothetical protein Thini_3802 [Thiothrix nivea DSM 5205]
MLSATTTNTKREYTRFLRNWSATLLLMIVSINSVTVEAGGMGMGNVEGERIRQGFVITPVPLNLHSKNRALVGLGSYLTNGVGGCNDCHTSPTYAPGGNPFNGEAEKINTDGYLAGGGVFGPFVESNITPDASGLPAGLTRKEFISLMRTGKDPHEANKTLQVMPWPIYGNMTYRDLSAIYEYLRSIPALPNNY